MKEKKKRRMKCIGLDFYTKVFKYSPKSWVLGAGKQNAALFIASAMPTSTHHMAPLFTDHVASTVTPPRALTWLLAGFSCPFSIFSLPACTRTDMSPGAGCALCLWLVLASGKQWARGRTQTRSASRH